MGTVDVIGCVGHCKGAGKGVGKVIEASEETIFFFFYSFFSFGGRLMNIGTSDEDEKK